MKNNKNIIICMFVSIAILSVLCLSSVSAFSVSSPYMANKTLNILQDSKITDLEFVLQNGGGATENISVRVSILEGLDIASITDTSNIYTVIPGEKVPVNVRITLPTNVTVGNSYNIRLEFSTITEGQSGQFGFGTGQEQNFKVLIVTKEITETNNLTYLYLIVGILLLAFIIVLLLIKRRNKAIIKKK
jgi:LPXTG-motif cell wall-anchored protein